MEASDKKTLLELARQTIIARINRQPLPAPENPTPALNVHSGCFVTIKRQGQLRGCIGNFISQQPLWQTVQEMAVSAATGDPRFQPMQVSELADFSLEISALSPLQKIRDISEIQVGIHGIYIVKGAARGVLLPQVATDYNWDLDTFLRQTCRKAGLPDNAWQTGADIYIFSADVFGET